MTLSIRAALPPVVKPLAEATRLEIDARHRTGDCMREATAPLLHAQPGPELGHAVDGHASQVTINTLTADRRQVRLALFRQLIEEHNIVEWNEAGVRLTASPTPSGQ
jgi:hypothetical protein